MFVAPLTVRDPSAYREARRLRAEEGLPFKRIATRLGVSPSTAHAWTRDIAVSESQRERNLVGPGGPQNPDTLTARAAEWSRRWRDTRLRFQEEGRRRAREGGPLHMAGCMLYWAEGSKERNTAKLANSDAHLVRFFRRFVSECFGIEAERFSFRLNVYLGNDLSLRHIENHWREHLDLPRSCLRRHTINHLPTSSSGRRLNKLPYGVCTLSVRRSTSIVQHIYGAIQEYGGFDEPAWLDGPPRKSRAPQAAAASRSAS